LKAQTDITLTELLAIANGQTSRDKEVAKLSERAKRIAADATQLATDFAVFVNGNANGVVQATASKPKTKRAAVSVTDYERALVSQFLSDRPFSIKEIARAALAGRTRTTAEALRRLAAEGKAVEGPRGKWKLVVEAPAAAPAAEDGASE